MKSTINLPYQLDRERQYQTAYYLPYYYTGPGNGIWLIQQIPNEWFLFS